VSSKLVEIAQKSMDTGDKMQFSYTGRIEGKYGYLVLTKKKLMFLREEGFLSKTYSVVFNLTYDKVRSYSSKQRFTLEILDITGGSKVFVSEVAASIIEDAMKSLIPYRKVAVPAS
jgi:hypothetical protein